MKISDNVKRMTNKIDEALKLTIKDEFIHGYLDENNVRVYPSIIQLSKRHNVANVSLHRWSKKEEWQVEKNKIQTEYETALAKERIKNMVESGKKLDDSAITLSLAMMADVGRRLQEDRENRRVLNEISQEQNDDARQKMLINFKKTKTILSSHDITSLANATANAQKIGKLALGQAQEISKVSANVTAPDSLRSVIQELDELASRKSSRAKHIIQ